MLLPTAGGFPPATPQGGIVAGSQPPPDTAKPVEILDAMLKLATLYRASEPDQQDKLVMERVSTLVQQLLAKDEADQQAAASPQALPGR